jgi:hypothetical protein
MLRDLPFFTPRLEDDTEFPFTPSSMPPILGTNLIEEPSILALPSHSWPLNVNDFNDLDLWHAPYDDHVDEGKSLSEERTSMMTYSFAELAVAEAASDVQQSQLGVPNMASSSLSSGSNSDKFYEPEKRVSKTRTRRRSSKPLKGPNPHGRTGKRRCELCRSKRQGVRSRVPSQR